MTGLTYADLRLAEARLGAAQRRMDACSSRDLRPGSEYDEARLAYYQASAVRRFVEEYIDAAFEREFGAEGSR